jgi:hypothetical protein
MDIAQEVIDKRICPKTSRSYACYVNKFKNWLKNRNENLYLNANNEIILPVPYEEQTILTYLGAVKNMNRNGILVEDYLIAKSTMMGLISAIHFLYKENNIELQTPTKLRLSSFIRGYNRVVTDAKQQGKMKILKGKNIFLSPDTVP